MSSIRNDPYAAAMLGFDRGETVIQMAARRDDVGPAYQDIAPGAGAEYGGFLDYGVSAPLVIKSDSDEDRPGGAGCHEVRVIGLGADRELKVREYTTGGIAGVLTTDSWSRVWLTQATKALATRVGNIGTLLVTSQAAGSPLMAEMLPGKGRSLSTNFSMPAGMQGALRVVTLGAGDNKIGEVELLTGPISEAPCAPFVVELPLPVSGGPRDVQGSVLIEAQTDVVVRAKAAQGSMLDMFVGYIVYVMTHEGPRRFADITP